MIFFHLPSLFHSCDIHTGGIMLSSPQPSFHCSGQAQAINRGKTVHTINLHFTSRCIDSHGKLWLLHISCLPHPEPILPPLYVSRWRASNSNVVFRPDFTGRYIG